MLANHHLQQLKESAISDDIISERGYCTFDCFHDWYRATTGDFPTKRITDANHLPFPGLGIPLFKLGKQPAAAWVLRPDNPRKKDDKIIKYEYPRSQSNVLDILPRFQQALADPDTPIWITEGAKKADALSSAFGNAIVAINENGVWGWRSKGKLVEDVKFIVWEGRHVVLAPDGDVRHNKHVYQAIERQAKLLLALGVAEVQICLLPQIKDGPKLGVDDFLAAGHTIDELQSCLVEMGTVAQHTRVALMKHPDTNAPLYLPPGYDVQDHQIVKRTPTGPQHFYSGCIAIKETGINLHTHEETITVVWDRLNQLQEVSIPRISLSSGVRCAESLTQAFVHSVNAREMSRYLVEFIRENDEVLPRVQFVDRLGICGDGLSLPAGTIGLAQNTRYTGNPVVIGADQGAYSRALAQMLEWGNLPILWSTFALGLAGPALARLQINRNPVLMLAGTSTTGKTTAAHFAVGTYGNPTEKPLQIQCGSGSTTLKGIQQTLVSTNGVPVILDDVHMLMERDPRRLAGLIYDYANGQLYSFGTLDRKGGGGERIGGALLLTGEMIPEFAHTGSQRRILLLDCTRTPPLGAPPESIEGARRALLLDQAWKLGAGLFGHQVCERIWGDWASFKREVEALRHDTALQDLQAWQMIMATAAAVLGHAMDIAGLYIDHVELMRTWAELYRSGQQDHDPAKEAFDRILMMLGQCEGSDNARFDQKNQTPIRASWNWLTYDRKLVAARRSGEEYWRVFTTSPQWLNIVGPGAVVQFGSAWIKHGLALPHSDGSVSDRCFVGQGAWTPHCVLVPTKYFSSVHDNEEK